MPHHRTSANAHIYRSLEAQSLQRRSWLTRVADQLTKICGSSAFLVINASFFVCWVVVNIDMVPFFSPFDPYPFGLLTMIVSLEAIFLSIFVLISQNRSSQTNTIRDEVQLQVNLITEQELTKVLRVLAELRTQLGVQTRDVELEHMTKPIDQQQIETEIETEINEVR